MAFFFFFFFFVQPSVQLFNNPENYFQYHQKESTAANPYILEAANVFDISASKTTVENEIQSNQITQLSEMPKHQRMSLSLCVGWCNVGVSDIAMLVFLQHHD